MLFITVLCSLICVIEDTPCADASKQQFYWCGLQFASCGCVTGATVASCVFLLPTQHSSFLWGRIQTKTYSAPLHFMILLFIHLLFLFIIIYYFFYPFEFYSNKLAAVNLAFCQRLLTVHMYDSMHVCASTYMHVCLHVPVRLVVFSWRASQVQACLSAEEQVIPGTGQQLLQKTHHGTIFVIPNSFWKTKFSNLTSVDDKTKHRNKPKHLPPLRNPA